MATSKTSILDFKVSSELLSSAPCTGSLLAITAAGQLMVDFPGNSSGPLAARWLRGICAGTFAEISLPKTVLLVFEHNDPALPIIVGLLEDTLPQPASPVQVQADGKAQIIEAQEEIILRCGQSSIVLKRNGTIIAKGTKIISRSSGPQKIKGASISLN